MILVCAKYLHLNGKQETETNILVKVDNFAEMIMNATITGFGELKLKEDLLLLAFLEAVGLNNVNAKQESMIYRGILNYIGRFVYHYNNQEILSYAKQSNFSYIQ